MTETGEQSAPYDSADYLVELEASAQRAHVGHRRPSRQRQRTRSPRRDEPGNPYKALSADGNPSFATIIKVAKAPRWPWQAGRERGRLDRHWSPLAGRCHGARNGARGAAREALVTGLRGSTGSARPGCHNAAVRRRSGCGGRCLPSAPTGSREVQAGGTGCRGRCATGDALVKARSSLTSPSMSPIWGAVRDRLESRGRLLARPSRRMATHPPPFASCSTSCSRAARRFCTTETSMFQASPSAPECNGSALSHGAWMPPTTAQRSRRRLQIGSSYRARPGP